MRILLFSVRLGRRHSPVFESLAAGYLQRLATPWSAELRSFPSEAALLKAVESERRAHHATVWWLERSGCALSSEAVSKALEAVRLGGQRSLVAAVGPPDGWSATARASLKERDLLLSLGPMTLPHELARLVLAEQLYRAVTILNGHPYHLGHE